MKTKHFRAFVSPWLIDNGSRFRLKTVDPDDTGDFSRDQDAAKTALLEGIDRLRTLQEKLYAQDQWGALFIFQAMDAAGKDGAIEHVMSGVNPQGCEVYSFKQPSLEELDHDFLWRTVRRLPERGRIGIFNRSYYEEVLVVRVHPEILANQKLPASSVDQDVFDGRYEDITAHERYLARNGYVIRKFFLHISKDEQTKRFQDRVDDPEKQWKFSLGDLREQERWPDYMDAYETAIRRTATRHAPWVVIPANHKWFARLVVVAAIIDALEGLHLDFPGLTAAKRKELEQGRKILGMKVSGRRRD
ncbi:MAG: polyphosphate kinase 2 family protein [Vicinamibacterales bacterium]